MPAGRWSLKRDVALPVALLVAMVVVDVLLPPTVVISIAFAIAPLVASALTTVRRTAGVAVAATGLGALSALWNHNFATLDWWTRLALTAALGLLAILLARIRAQREQALMHMTVIAETAQRALLRTMPREVGSVGLAARYVSATESALVGGDLYEVAETPYGVRVIVGDVRGKGLEAVQMAATVVAAFRKAVFLEPDLNDIAAELDEVVAATAGDEDFVTAVMAEFHSDATVTLVNCGHHPPLLITNGVVKTMDTGEPEVPLGLRTVPHAVRAAWPAGSRLLLFTDGLVETRDRQGTFFPLHENAGVLGVGDLDEALDRLLTRLVAYAGQRINDDMALVLVEHRTD